MNQRRHDEAMARATRFYAWLLRLYPRRHRQAFGAQMLQTFRDHYRDAVEAEGGSVWRFWLGVIGDASGSLVSEHHVAFSERIVSMRKILSAFLAVLGILVVGALALGPLLLGARSFVAGVLLSPGDLGSAFANSSFALWLLGVLVALVVRRSPSSGRTRPEAG